MYFTHRLDKQNTRPEGLSRYIIKCSLKTIFIIKVKHRCRLLSNSTLPEGLSRYTCLISNKDYHPPLLNPESQLNNLS
jgi:hypothetical protein